MPNKKTDLDNQGSENNLDDNPTGEDEKETPEKDQTAEDGELAEDGEKKEGEKKQVPKKGENPYEEELTKVKEIIAHKNRAIESLKKDKEKNKEEIENLQQDIETIKTAIRDELKAEFEGMLTGKIGEVKDIVLENEVSSRIVKYSGDNEAARELIRVYYDKVTKNSDIYPTLNEKIRAAAFLANQNIILSRAKEQGKQSAREDALKNLIVPQSASAPEEGYDESDPAVAIVKAVNPKALKYLKKK